MVALAASAGQRTSCWAIQCSVKTSPRSIWRKSKPETAQRAHTLRVPSKTDPTRPLLKIRFPSRRLRRRPQASMSVPSGRQRGRRRPSLPLPIAVHGQLQLFGLRAKACLRGWPIPKPSVGLQSQPQQGQGPHRLPHSGPQRNGHPLRGQQRPTPNSKRRCLVQRP